MIFKPSLRLQLTIPFVAITFLLVFLVSAFCNWNAYSTIDRIAERWLEEKTINVAQAIESNFVGADFVINAAMPQEKLLSMSLDDQIKQLHQHFWHAVALQNEAYNSLYYFSENGSVYSLTRLSNETAAAYYQAKGSSTITRYAISVEKGKAIEDEFVISTDSVSYLPSISLQSAHHRKGQINTFWNPKTKQVSALFSHAVVDRYGQYRGTVATEIPIEALQIILQSNTQSDDEKMMVIEKDTNMVISSNIDAQLAQIVDGQLRSVPGNKPIRSIAESIISTISNPESTIDSLSTNKPNLIPDKQHGDYYLTIRPLKIGDSQQWILVIAKPISYFFDAIHPRLLRNVILGLLSAAFCGWLGYRVASSASRDIRTLAEAAKLIGQGELNTAIDIYRDDDIGRLADQFRQMEIDLRSDRLTGLYSRHAFEKAVDQRILSYQKHGYQGFAILFLDINSFKHINDTMGHQVGDEIIKLVARKLKALCGEQDIIARYAGDEFVILFDYADNKQRLPKIIKDIETLHTQVREVGELDNKILDRIDFSLALGISHFPEDGHSATALIDVADHNMYSDKRRLKRDQEPKF